MSSRKEFEKYFAQSWKHFQKLQYIDLLAFHCVSKETTAKRLLSDDESSPMAAALEYQKQGKIRHIGFSTHGSAKLILKLINSQKFAFVNLHCHYFGSYHAEGTADGQGGHGNHHAVQRALELDMGVFQISPLDKGGMVYKPSTTLAKTLGPKISPIDFALLTGWYKIKAHTASVGFARMAGLEDSLHAARMYELILNHDGDKRYTNDIEAAMERVKDKMIQELGEDWYHKGLLNLPSCDEQLSHGTAIGHVLWCYNLLKSFGMYDFCLMRYNMLLGCPWDAKLDFEANVVKKMNEGNMGRAYLPEADYTEALKNHYDPPRALALMKQTHDWMVATPQTTPSNDWATRQHALGFDAAYDLRVWDDFPGDMAKLTLTSVLLQNFTFGLLGAGGGPTKAFTSMADRLIQLVREDNS
ncbi:hypothetical protein ACA910_002019 [Epithemia clementina (nom. ined.)]